MKYTISQVPANAFIKVSVSQAARKVYFKDVKTYRKIWKRACPPIPHFHACPQKQAEVNTDEENSDESCCNVSWHRTQ